jgi:D-lactate dehydrogenase (cytochrome)
LDIDFGFDCFSFFLTFKDLDGSLLAQLRSLLGSGRVSEAEVIRSQHGKDEGPYEPMLPQLVVFPESTAEVSEVAKLCNAHDTPMIPFGTGTGLEGGTLAMNGGVCLDLTKIDGVGEVRAEDFNVTVRPGVTRLQLNQFVKDAGLWFPVGELIAFFPLMYF